MLRGVVVGVSVVVVCMVVVVVCMVVVVVCMVVGVVVCMVVGVVCMVVGVVVYMVVAVVGIIVVVVGMACSSTVASFSMSTVTVADLSMIALPTPPPLLTSNPYAPVSSLLNHTSYTPSFTAYTSLPTHSPTSSTRLQIISNGYDCNRPRAKRVLQYVQ